MTGCNARLPCVTQWFSFRLRYARGSIAPPGDPGAFVIEMCHRLIASLDLAAACTNPHDQPRLASRLMFSKRMKRSSDMLTDWGG